MEALSRASAAAAISTRSVGQAANDAVKGIDTLADKVKKASDSARSFGDQSAHVAAFRAEVERLTQKYQPLAQATRSYETAISEIQQAHRLGVITADQMTSALEKERLAYEKLKTSASGANSSIKAANQNAPSSGARRAAGLNAGYQLQDIAVSAFGGASPALVALQQGTQLADAFAQTGGGIRGVASTAAAAVGTLFNPLSLATIAFSGLTAAAIQYFSKTSEGASSTNELLAQQNEIIQQAAKSWGDALPSVKAYAAQLDLLQHRTEGMQAVQVLSKEAFEGLGKDLLKTNQDFTAAVRSMRGIGADPKFIHDFVTGFSDLKSHLDDGTASLAQINNAQQLLAQALESYGTKAVEKFGATFERITGQINNAAAAARRSRSEFYSSIAGADNVQDIVSGSTFRGDNGKAVSTSSFIPRVVPTPTPRPNIELDGSDDDVIRAQIENSRRVQAAELRYLGAKSPSELAEAARNRESANVIPNETEAQTANRVNLAGVRAQTEAEFRLKQAQEDRVRSLYASVDAQKNELSLVGQTGAAAEALKMQYQLIAQVREAAARAGVPADEKEIELIKQKTAEYARYVDLRNQAQLNSDLDFQDRQAGRSARDQQIVTTLRQYGQPEDLNSPAANRIRQQLRNQDEKQAIDQFSNNLASNIVQSGGKIGKAFAQTFLSSLQEAAQKELSNIFSQLLKALLMPNSGAGATTQASVASGIGSIAAKAIGGANDNKAASSVPNTDVAAYITQAAIKRGIDPTTALAVAKSEGGLSSWNKQSGVFKNGVQEPSFGPYQLYMGGGLGNAFQKQTGLDPRAAANGPAGVDFALDYASKNGWGSWYGAKNTGISNWQGIGANSNVNTAADAVNKLAQNSQAAAANVGTFGNGLGQLGQSLGSNIFPAAPQASGGGGILGWLGGLFGGSKSSQWNLATAGKLKLGLFASGTNYAPGGPAIVGEDGPELLDLPQGSQVTSNHKLMSALAANSNQPQPNRTLMVNVQGASGDDHVRTLVQQGVGAALNDYNTQQRRGGVGVLQARYSNQKV